MPGLVRLWDDVAESAKRRRYRRLPNPDDVRIDERRHWVVLVAPVVRTGIALGVLAGGPSFGGLLLFAATLWGWARAPGRDWRSALGLVAVLTLVLLGVSAADEARLRGTAVLAVIGWLLYDVIDRESDRLVVTSSRLFRLHGVVVTHNPSISLTAIAYVDVAQGPLGALLHYGTIQLDTHAQHDQPLSRFHHIRDVHDVQRVMLKLRWEAHKRSYPPFGETGPRR